MAESFIKPNTFEFDVEASHLSALIDQIEVILASPAEFTSSTLETRLSPLLRAINECDLDDDLYDRVIQLERWCNQLQDATRAAFTRETILKCLGEIESWEDWSWDTPVQEIDIKKSQIDGIKRILKELPIEWLKSRVTGINYPPF
jgi:hypothetical protein